MKFIYYLLLIFTLTSCSNYYNIILVADNVSGLKNESGVEYKGLEIGTVKDIKINEKGKLLIYTKINSDINIPIDSKFKLEQSGLLLDNKFINVNFGKSKKYIQDNSLINISK